MSPQLQSRIENCKANISVLRTVDLMILKDTVEEELRLRGY